MCIASKCDKMKKEKFEEDESVQVVQVMLSTVQRINSYLGECAFQ